MRTALLGTVARVVSGGTPKTSNDELWGGDVAWATPKDLSSLASNTISQTERTITQQGLQSCSAELLPARSVLLSSRAPIGLVAINTVPMATNQGFKSLVPHKDHVDAGFLYWWLRANTVRLQSLGVGATFKEISKSTLSRVEISLPNMVEQRRIADIFDKADVLRAKRREAIAHLDALGQSIFHEMFGAVDYPKYRLDEIADVTSGITKGRKVPIDAVLTETPYMAVSNVQDMSLDMDVVKTIEVTETEIIRYSLEKDDLLMTEGGDPDKLGRGTLWTGEIEPCLHQNHIYRVRIRTGAQALPVYLNWATASGGAKEYFLRCAKQTTGIASINKTQLSATPIPLPPLDLQIEFVRRVSAVERLKANHSAQLAELDALFLSLQDRAFKGEL